MANNVPLQIGFRKKLLHKTKTTYSYLKYFWSFNFKWKFYSATSDYNKA